MLRRGSTHLIVCLAVRAHYAELEAQQRWPADRRRMGMVRPSFHSSSPNRCSPVVPSHLHLSGGRWW